MKCFGVLCFIALCIGLFVLVPPLGIGLLVIGVVIKILMK